MKTAKDVLDEYNKIYGHIPGDGWLIREFDELLKPVSQPDSRDMVIGKLKEYLERLKLEFDVNVCECGEKWSDSDGSAIVDEAVKFALPRAGRFEKMQRVIEAAQEINKYAKGETALNAGSNLFKRLKEALEALGAEGV